MFENIIDQAAVLQLEKDVQNGKLARAMLFFGPSASGKGSAALELARVSSCEGDLSWKCACPSCRRHRYLLHGDLLMTGFKPFSAEIAASFSAFAREPEATATRILFIRSLRKLTARFSPVFMAEDPRTGKLSPLLQALQEGLNELEEKQKNTAGKAGDKDGIEKLCKTLVKDALKLESEGIGSFIPVAHLRAAQYWCRLAPTGRRKTLIIENAGRMKDEGRNSLLKLLEEPPAALNIVLTEQRREAIMETLLSRLRPYRFLGRDREKEREVIRRVFRDSWDSNPWDSNPMDHVPQTPANSAQGLLSYYMDSFLPQNTEKLYPLAAFFLASLARAAAVARKKKGASELPSPVKLLGERFAPIAESAGFARSFKDRDVIKTLLAGGDGSESGKLDADSMTRFLSLCLDMAGSVFRETGPWGNVYSDIFRKRFNETEAATGVLNQSVPIAAEALFYRLKTDIETAAAGSGT